jgi:hypothetical protein
MIGYPRNDRIRATPASGSGTRRCHSGWAVQIAHAGASHAGVSHTGIRTRGHGLEPTSDLVAAGGQVVPVADTYPLRVNDIDVVPLGTRGIPSPGLVNPTSAGVP